MAGTTKAIRLLSLLKDIKPNTYAYIAVPGFIYSASLLLSDSLSLSKPLSKVHKKHDISVKQQMDNNKTAMRILYSDEREGNDSQVVQLMFTAKSDGRKYEGIAHGISREDFWKYDECYCGWLFGGLAYMKNKDTGDKIVLEPVGGKIIHQARKLMLFSALMFSSYTAVLLGPKLIANTKEPYVNRASFLGKLKGRGSLVGLVASLPLMLANMHIMTPQQWGNLIAGFMPDDESAHYTRTMQPAHAMIVSGLLTMTYFASGRIFGSAQGNRAIAKYMLRYRK